MRSKKGKSKKGGIILFNISIHIILIGLFAFPFLKSAQSEDLIYKGLLVQFNPLTPTTKPSNSKEKSVNYNLPKKAAETKVLKPKLEKSRKQKNIADKRVLKDEELISSLKPSVIESENLEKSTITEKRRDYLVKTIQTAVSEQERERDEKISREKLEMKTKREKYEKMKSVFSHLLKNATNETSFSSTDFNLSDESLSESVSPSENRGTKALANRHVIFVPEIEDSSQKEGRVVIKICVDAVGHVVFSKYTQKESTTTDSYLIDLATKNARLYVFSKSKSPRQCGIVNIDFRLK